MRKLHGILLAASIAVASATFGQLSDGQKLIQLNKLLAEAMRASGSEDKTFMSPYILDSIMIAYQNTLSGSQVEAGKSIGSSISITDKGAVANIGIKRIGDGYTQINIGGQGKDNFISLFDKGQYGNTISIGAKYQLFLPGSGYYNPEDANRLHNRLAILKGSNGAPTTTGGTITTAYDTKLTYLYGQIQNLASGNSAYENAAKTTPALSDADKQNLEPYLQAADTLIKLGLLPEKFFDFTDKERASEIKTLTANWTTATTGPGPAERRLRYYLQEAEALQMKANWNLLTFCWFTFGLDFNVTPYKILDAEKKADDYTRTDNDNYFSGSVSLNFLRLRPRGDQRRFFASPTVKFSYARVYKDADKMTLERLLPYTINTDELSRKTLTTEVYTEVAARKFVSSLEVPFIWYWNKWNVGIEFSPKVGVNDPKEDNVGFRFGIFIPAQITSGVPLIIQPVFRTQQLFTSSTASFWKDNVVVGFNISVSMPKGLGKIGK